MITHDTLETEAVKHNLNDEIEKSLVNKIKSNFSDIVVSQDEMDILDKLEKEAIEKFNSSLLDQIPFESFDESNDLLLVENELQAITDNLLSLDLKDTLTNNNKKVSNYRRKTKLFSKNDKNGFGETTINSSTEYTEIAINEEVLPLLKFIEPIHLYSKPSLDNENNVIVLIDLETTGLSPNYDFVIQIGACLYDNKAVKFNKYINSSDIHISKKITEITKITKSKLNCYGDTFLNIWDKFMHWINEIKHKKLNDSCKNVDDIPVIFIAHNGKRFDFKMLKSEFIRNNIILNYNNFWCLDSYHIIKNNNIRSNIIKFFGNTPESNSLSKLYNFLYKKEMEDSHDALGDVLGLNDILCHQCIKEIWKTQSNDMIFHINDI